MIWSTWSISMSMSLTTSPSSEATVSAGILYRKEEVGKHVRTTQGHLEKDNANCYV